MKIRQPILNVIPRLLVLGLMLLWIASSVDVRSMNNCVSDAEELQERFEEELEKKGLDRQFSPTIFCPVIREVAAEDFKLFCRLPASPVFTGTSGHPSGWKMPLRI